jgi:hypothetical protein
MNRKFKLISINREIYCSSSHHYHVTAVVEEKGKRWQCTSALYEHSFPRYLRDEISYQLRSLFVTRNLVVYEYNRNGVKRYEDYRYHTPWLLAREIGLADKDLPAWQCAVCQEMKMPPDYEARLECELCNRKVCSDCIMETPDRGYPPYRLLLCLDCYGSHE